MEIKDVFIGQHVAHVRGDFSGKVLDVVEQPEPFPPHLSVRLTDSQTVVCAPINQLQAVRAPHLRAGPDAPPAGNAGTPANSGPTDIA